MKNIELNKLKKLIPYKLNKVIEYYDLKKFGDLLNIDDKDLLKMKGAGPGTVKEMKKFKEYVKHNKNKIMSSAEKNEYEISIQRNRAAKLLKDISKVSEFTPVELFKLLVEDYFNTLKKYRKRDKEIVYKYYGLGNNKPAKRNVISEELGLTSERVRQLIVKHRENLRSLLLYNELEEEQLKVANKTSKNILKPINELSKLSVFNDTHLNKIHDKYNVNKKLKNYFKLLLDSFNLKVFLPNLATYRLTKLYIINEDLFLKDFKKFVNHIYIDLRKELSGKSVEELRKSLPKSMKKSLHLVEPVLEAIEEVEKVKKDGSEVYRIKTPYLHRYNLQAERVLESIGHKVHIDKIVEKLNEINRQQKSKKQHTSNTLSSNLVQNKNIVPIGKTGWYTLKKWGDNTDSIEGLLKSIIKKKGKPLPLDEIIETARSIRPNINYNSLKIILNMKFIQLRNRKFIIPEWKSKYSSEMKPKRSITNKKLKIFNYVSENIKGWIKLSKATNKVQGQFDFHKSTIYNSLRDENYFDLKRDNNTIYVRALKEPKIKYNKKTDTVIKNAKNILRKNKGEMELRHLVKKLKEMYGYSPATSYSAISSSKQFKKTPSNDKTKTVHLVE